jgi:hypothetical protein
MVIPIGRNVSGFEVFTEFIPVVSRRFRGKYFCHPQKRIPSRGNTQHAAGRDSCSLFPYLNLRSWKRKQYFLPKRRQSSTEIHIVSSQQSRPTLQNGLYSAPCLGWFWAVKWVTMATFVQVRPLGREAVYPENTNTTKRCWFILCLSGLRHHAVW